MKRLLTFFAALLFAAAAYAEELAPDALVKSVSSDVLAIVSKDKDIQSGDVRRAVELAEAKVLPHFDFLHMTRLAMGKDWRKATPDQQKALVDEFRALLVRTYSKAFVEYRNQTINYKPFRMAPNDTDALVRTSINQSGGKPIEIDYNLDKTDKGWKVYDISVAGVSLVTNYRSSFNQEVSTGGVDGLLASLREKNRAADGSSGERK